MEAYVLEASGTFLCAVASKKGCSAKETEYIVAYSEKPLAEVEDQLKRLEGVLSKNTKMKKKLKKWVYQRVAILKQLVSTMSSSSQSEAELNPNSETIVLGGEL